MSAGQAAMPRAEWFHLVIGSDEAAVVKVEAAHVTRMWVCGVLQEVSQRRILAHLSRLADDSAEWLSRQHVANRMHNSSGRRSNLESQTLRAISKTTEHA